MADIIGTRYSRSDSDAAVETLGVDASHGRERIHRDVPESLGQLVARYLLCPPSVHVRPLGTLVTVWFICLNHVKNHDEYLLGLTMLPGPEPGDVLILPWPAGPV